MTIQEIKQLVNQRIIENYTGDITAEDVNRIMNETLDHVGGNDSKISDLSQEMAQIDSEHRNILSVVLALFKKAVYTGNVTSEIAELERLLGISSKAICGECLCGEVLCGQI